MCPVTDWSDWSPCSASCGKGVKLRTRLLLVAPELQEKCSTRVELVQQRHCVMQEDCTFDMAIAKRKCTPPPPCWALQSYTELQPSWFSWSNCLFEFFFPFLFFHPHSSPVSTSILDTVLFLSFPSFYLSHSSHPLHLLFSPLPSLLIFPFPFFAFFLFILFLYHYL
jgi:hypothetical protein